MRTLCLSVPFLFLLACAERPAKAPLCPAVVMPAPVASQPPARPPQDLCGAILKAVENRPVALPERATDGLPKEIDLHALMTALRKNLPFSCRTFPGFSGALATEPTGFRQAKFTLYFAEEGAEAPVVRSLALPGAAHEFQVIPTPSGPLLRIDSSSSAEAPSAQFVRLPANEEASPQNSLTAVELPFVRWPARRAESFAPCDPKACGAEYRLAFAWDFVTFAEDGEQIVDVREGPTVEVALTAEGAGFRPVRGTLFDSDRRIPVETAGPDELWHAAVLARLLGAPTSEIVAKATRRCETFVTREEPLIAELWKKPLSVEAFDAKRTRDFSLRTPAFCFAEKTDWNARHVAAENPCHGKKCAPPVDLRRFEKELASVDELLPFKVRLGAAD